MIGDPESQQVRELLRLVDRELSSLRIDLDGEDELAPAVRVPLEIRQELLLRMATALVEAGDSVEHSPLLAQLISAASSLPEEDLRLLLPLARRMEARIAPPAA